MMLHFDRGNYLKDILCTEILYIFKKHYSLYPLLIIQKKGYAQRVTNYLYLLLNHKSLLKTHRIEYIVHIRSILRHFRTYPILGLATIIVVVVLADHTVAIIVAAGVVDDELRGSTVHVQKQ